MSLFSNMRVLALLLTLQLVNTIGNGLYSKIVYKHAEMSGVSHEFKCLYIIDTHRVFLFHKNELKTHSGDIFYPTLTHIHISIGTHSWKFKFI